MLAIAIARGEDVLGCGTGKGEVLYLALEDNRRRLKSRLQKLGASKDVPGLHFATAWKRADQGGLQHPRDWLVVHTGTRCVILDTLAKLRPPGRHNANPYEEDYRLGDAIKQLADEFRIAIICVTHLRKAYADDVFDTISGTLGLAGAFDGALILRRERGENTATLYVAGRDIEDERELGLEWHPDEARWKAAGSAAEVRMTAERRRLLNALRQEGPMTAVEAAKVAAMCARFGPPPAAEDGCRGGDRPALGQAVLHTLITSFTVITPFTGTDALSPL